MDLESLTRNKLMISEDNQLEIQWRNNMGNLILSGGGNADQNSSVHNYFVNSIERDKPLLYIPLAGDPSFRSYGTSLKYVQSIFNPLGVDAITMWTELNNKSLSELKRFSAVYFSGGCTLTLLKALKKSNFDKILMQYYESGGTIFGQSAGAIIFGSHITHTNPKGENSAEYEPLNLIYNYRLWCHYDAREDKLIYQFSEDGGPPFLALPDGAAIRFSDNSMEIISKQAYEFKQGKKKTLKI